MAIKAFKRGNDINVYLFAAQEYLSGQNIYLDNPYNHYLYSPLFAWMLSSLTHFPWDVARVLWFGVNILCLWRLFNIFYKYILSLDLLSTKNQRWWIGVVIFSSLGFIIHNVNLGQITIPILWLTAEAIESSRKKQWLKAALFLALGINIKIIPLIVLGYWFLQGKFKTLIATTLLLALSFVLPALYSGWNKNVEHHQTWFNTINPVGEKYAFEFNNGCHSLNALLPAFFLKNEVRSRSEMLLPKKGMPTYIIKRDVLTLSEKKLGYVLSFLRIFFLLSVAVIVFYRSAHRRRSLLYHWWEVAYLLLISLLVFPHQMKYSMLYAVPTLAYLGFYFLALYQHKTQLNFRHKFSLGLLVFLLVLLGLSGRDIIGETAVDFLDFYHSMAWANIIFVGLLYYLNPHRFNRIYLEKTRKSLPTK